MSYDDELVSLLNTTLVQKEDFHIELENPLSNTTADKSCSYYDFIIMVQKVVRNVMSDIEFMPDDDIKIEMFPDKVLNKPLIGYKVYKRRPFKEIKPLERHEVKEKVPNSDESRIGTLYAQRMEYILQFNVFSSGYAISEKVMNTFEEAMMEYTFYFKQNGVCELIFDEQLEDTAYDQFRQKCSCRHLRYRAIFEKNWIDFESALETVQINNQTDSERR